MCFVPHMSWTKCFKKKKIPAVISKCLAFQPALCWAGLNHLIYAQSRIPFVSHFQPFCPQPSDKTMFLSISTRNSSIMEIKGTRERMGGATDPGCRDGGSSGNEAGVRLLRHTAYHICTLSLWHLPNKIFLQSYPGETLQFMCEGQKNKLTNLYILNTWVFVISSLYERFVDGKGRKGNKKHLLKENFS